MNWQPIETAPKDGTRILAIDSRAITPEPMVVYWDQASDRNWPVYVESYDGDQNDLGWLPYASHWMPLPELPTEPTSKLEPVYDAIVERVEEYGVCCQCEDELPMRDLSVGGLCIECRYEMDARMPDPQEVEE